MVFSSTVFLFLFLPITLLVSFVLSRKWQNYWLLAASLFFYAWGGVHYTLILVASLLLNYFAGLAMNKWQKHQKNILILGVGLNLALLVLFKYANFMIDNLNYLLSLIGVKALHNKPIVLPIGISFFTFQAISYLVDLYRNDAKVQKSLAKLSLYISLFPQLIAGPIVRYQDIDDQLNYRKRTLKRVISGIERFIIGLAKKVLLANTFAVVADNIYGMNEELVSPSIALLAAVSYSFQIYFDFAGYSDMAIGLGRMFGFEFKENFNFPYVAKSIQDFWRRWHISLSTWFRDYLYIPLGGNRKGPFRVYFNLLLVFLCTGFWHGDSWNFIFWGLFHGTFLIVERLGLAKILNKLPSFIGRVYTLIIVLIGWIFFRVENIDSAILFTKLTMANAWGGFQLTDILIYLEKDYLIALSVAAFSLIGYSEKIYNKLVELKPIPFFDIIFSIGKYALLLLVLIICMAYLSTNTYNPFIYFRF